ncbi:DUF4388 domain-containing protein [Caldisericum sp. AR60]|jgi:hypothetical protein|uniref:DUF4388 domain-containing protein n=1 Tax=unclassified Caldisericum TaxID=2641600 RepID=UPI0039FD71E7
MALQGNLSDFKLEEVIQSISTSKKSGKLEVDGVMGMYGIYFSNGEIIHANGPFSIGEEAILDVFLEINGTFSFITNIVLPPRTIKKDLFDIIATGINLREENIDILKKITKKTKMLPNTKNDTNGIELSKDEIKLLKYILDGTPISTIMEEMSMSYLKFLEVLKGLLKKEIVILGG